MWNYQAAESTAPAVEYEIAMETLKNSSIQMVFKVDHSFSEFQTDRVIKKLKNEEFLG